MLHYIESSLTDNFGHLAWEQGSGYRQRWTLVQDVVIRF